MAVDLDDLAGPKGADEGRRLAAFWLEQIQAVRDNVEYKRWVKRGEGIEDRYRDERKRTADGDTGVRRYSSLWSNVEILMPALYGKTPVPIAERRFRDKDPVARGAAQILERGLRNEIEICGFDEAMQQAVRDYLLPGRGTVWVRYEPEIEDGISLPVETETDKRDALGTIPTAAPHEDGEPAPRSDDEIEADREESIEKLEATGDRITRESTPVDFIQWPDFFTFPIRARIWAEVTAVAKRVYMSRDQMRRRFGNSIGRGIPLERDDRGKQDKNQNPSQSPSDADKGQVYEIWSKDDETIYWVAEGYEYLCDRKDDPLKLENFFPCPRPIFANATNTTLIPVPDYIQYQDQAAQIDELTQRIALLTRACKVAGVYNAAAKDIQRLFEETTENKLIPVDDWAAFAEKGGVEGNISLLPVKDIVGVLNELQQCKTQQIEEMDRLTGINDVMRGTTDARETLGGQRLKTNSTGTRLTHRQNDVARFARDTVRIMADIMSQHFSPQSLIEVSGALYLEGLGSVDMPNLTDVQSMPAPTPAAPPAPPQMPQVAGPSPVPGPGSSPPPSMGQNVVPFRPPGMPAPAMPPQMPTGAPAPMGAPMPSPGPPPELMAKIEGLKRIVAAIKMLRIEKLRGFRVDIETDSTIYGDSAQEKADRIEFIKTVTEYLTQAMGLVTSMPEIMPLLGKFLQFGVRGFRVGRDLESAIEEFCEEAPAIVKKKVEQAASQPNPDMIKAQAAMVTAQATGQEKGARVQTEQIKAQSDAHAAEMQAASDGQQAQAEIERQRIENEGEQQNAQADLASKQIDREIAIIKLKSEETSAKVDQIVEMLKLKQAQVGADQAEIQAKERTKQAKKQTEKASQTA